MFSLALKDRGPAARDELQKNLDQLRDELASRLGEVDVKTLRKRGKALRKQSQELAAEGLDYAGEVRRQLKKTGLPGALLVPQRRRRKRRWPLMAMLVGAGIGAAAVTAYFLYDRQRREAVRQRLSEVQGAAYERYVSLGGSHGKVNGSDLRDRVVSAISGDGEFPKGLEVEIEGRTVYLKGEVADAAAADAAAERAHTVEGVVAVVNHTTSPAPSQG
jgi:osmotically-inducible protein OsmY